MSKSSLQSFRIAVALGLLGPVIPAVGVPTITIGTNQLLPNTPGQIVEIQVFGQEPVQSLELFLQVGNGGPELERSLEDYAIPAGTGIPGPAITAIDLLNGTIFTGNNYGQLNPTDGDAELPQLMAAYIGTASGTVPPSGRLARVTIDTTGITSGTFPLSLRAYGVTSTFDIPTGIIDGTLIVGAGQPVPVNQRPVADAGADKGVAGGTTVQLIGSGTDPEGATVTYQWRQIDGPAVVLTNSSTSTCSFKTPRGLVNVRLTFELTVSDGVNTGSDTVVVTVNSQSSVFTVDAGLDRLVAPGTPVPLDATVSSPTQRTFTYEWLQVGGPSVTLTLSGASGATFIAPVAVANTALTFEVRVTDGTYETVDTVRVTVDADSAKPTAYAGEDQAVAAGAAVQLTGTGIDPAGFGLSYLWVQIAGPAVTLSSEIVPNPTFTAPSAATASRIEFELRVSSGAVISVDTVAIDVAAASTPNGTTDDDTTDPGVDDSTEDSTTGSSDLFSGLFSFNWPTATTIAVGFAILLIALILLWIFIL